MWLDLALLFVEPARLEEQAAALAARMRPHACDLVCGPLVGGALLGQRVATALGVPFVFAERHGGRDEIRYAIPGRMGLHLPHSFSTGGWLTGLVLLAALRGSHSSTSLRRLPGDRGGGL